MTTFDTLLLLLIVSLVVVGVTVAAILNRIFKAICTVTNPVAAVLDRIRAQELRDANQAQDADEALDADELDADDVLDAAVYRYRRALTHCHKCEEAAREARQWNEPKRRFSDGWRVLTLACPRAGCGGCYVVSVHKDTRALGTLACRTECEHTMEMAANPEDFFSLSSLQLPTYDTRRSPQ